MFRLLSTGIAGSLLTSAGVHSNVLPGLGTQAAAAGPAPRREQNPGLGCAQGRRAAGSGAGAGAAAIVIVSNDAKTL